jgi:formylglycine-generating enzyme required for sulfatase activity
MPNATTSGPTATKKLRVFLSYSRKDGAFTRCLADALAARGYVPDFDQANYGPDNVDSGISAEDEWWQRLQAMIASADAMVFVVSPDSAASKVCDEEIAYARGLGKRIIPVLRRPIDYHKAPPRLTALNIKIQFLEEAAPAFDVSLAELCVALDVDVDWYRESRRLTGLAVRWNQLGRPDDLLLTTGDVRAIGNLLENRPRSAPDPSPILVELREKSQTKHDYEARLRRRMQTVTIFLLFGIIVGLVGWINQDYVKERFNWYMTMRPYMLVNFRPYVLAAEAERNLKPKDVFRECAKDCPKMIVIPPGEFMMGSPDEEPGRAKNEGPRHKVTIAREFAVSVFDVTFDEWDACVSVGGCREVGDSGFGRGTRPATNVTWDDAQAYVAWLSRMTGGAYRLPTEAEWEYIARAGTTTTYYWGNELGKGNANCIVCGTEWDNSKTSPVGSFKPNPFALYDVTGNAWQWLQDCFHRNYEEAPTDGSAWTSGDCNLRADRGGSWISNASNLRIAFRGSYPAGSRNYSLGIRVARTLTP